MIATQTQDIDRKIEAATRFLDRIAKLAPAERERISTESFGSGAHTSAMLQTADEITALKNRDKSGRMSAFLVDLERRVESMGLSAEVGGLVKGAAKAILVHDLPGLDRSTKQLYTPFEQVVPFTTIRD
jgi:hypothetical protein